MNIKHLEHLLALADTGSFSRAAEKLFITQSALSRSIQSTEGDLGAKVLDRISERNDSRRWAWTWWRVPAISCAIRLSCATAHSCCSKAARGLLALDWARGRAHC